jgi:hypothetical protein
VTHTDINTLSMNIATTACPQWCETDHDEEESLCWGLDATITLSRMKCEPGPGQDTYKTLHTYLEQKPDGTTDMIINDEGRGFLTLSPQEAIALAQQLQWFAEMARPGWQHPFRTQ